MNEAQLNTVGYVLSRYGSLTGQDLEHLTLGEEPWQLADSGRRPGKSAHTSNLSGSSNTLEPTVVPTVTRTQGCSTRHLSPNGCRMPRNDVKIAVRRDSPEELMGRLEELRSRLTLRA